MCRASARAICSLPILTRAAGASGFLNAAPAHGRDVILQAEKKGGVHNDEVLTIAKQIIYTHHERWDGSGYPQGLSGLEIPILGRLIAVVDVYDALLTRRLYAERMTHDQAVAFVVAGRGTLFDPAVVDALAAAQPRLRALGEEAATAFEVPAPGATFA